MPEMISIIAMALFKRLNQILFLIFLPNIAPAHE